MTALAVPLLALGMACCADVQDTGSGETAIVFRVAVREDLNLDEDDELVVNLSLTNVGKQRAFVGPVIGQMCRSLGIWAHHDGADRPILLYHREHLKPSFALDSMFCLRPGRELEFDMDIHYSDVITEEGTYGVWAELDCTGMDKIVPQAFSGKLHSNIARFVFTRKAPRPLRQ